MRAVGAGSAVLALVLSGCGDGGGDSGSEATVLAEAYDICSSSIIDVLEEKLHETEDPVESSERMIFLEDDGATLKVLTLQPHTDYFAQIAISAARCVLEETGAPAPLIEEFSAPQPSAVDEYGDTDYEDVRLSWSNQEMLVYGDYYERNFNAEFKQG